MKVLFFIGFLIFVCLVGAVLIYEEKEVDMPNSIIITAMICITLIILAIIGKNRRDR